ncbi:MAG: phage baseplate assembly protein V [Kofleriaceae bacterium]|nr:phage baseplate assembly protein V [Kofleriaceae bacterium]
MSFLLRQVRDVQHERDRVYEPMIGVVTDNKDPAKLLRVKVRLPVLGGDSTWWVPIVSLGAGKDRGWFFLPEVNDEVLVVFEHGDLDRPVVIGTLWSGKAAPPSDNGDGKNAVRTLVSRGGSRVELDDEAGTVVISDGGGKGEIKMSADEPKITITAKQGDVCLQSPKGELHIVAGEISLKASVNLDVRGQNVNLGGDAGVTLKASGPITLFGATTDINPGGTPAPAKATGTVEEFPDPVGASGGTASGGASGGGGGGGAAPDGASGGASPGGAGGGAG